MNVKTNCSQQGVWPNPSSSGEKMGVSIFIVQKLIIEQNLAKNQKLASARYVRTIAVAARSTAWVCGRSLAGIVGSNPAGGMIVCLL